MANTLANILPKILARALGVLRERTVMPRLINSDYSSEAAQKGDTIDVPIPTSVGTRDVAPANIPPVPVDFNPPKVQIQLNKWRQSDPFYLTDKELNEVERNVHFLPMQVGEAVRGLARYVNQQIMLDYKKVYTLVGNPAVVPFSAGVADATNARKALNINLAPRDMRRGVLDFDAEASALVLAEFSDADKIMSAEVKIEGEIGRKYGIDWVADDDVQTHITGAAPLAGGIAIDNIGGYAAGAANALQSTIHIDGVVGAPVDGDIFTFAGHSQQYVVRATANPVATDLDVTISPALKAAVIDNEAMTFVASHKVNLVFHRDAFAFATRPLQASTSDMSFGSQIVTLQDPVTGLVLRLEVSRQHKQVAWEFDLLFGNQLVRPQLATRLAGAI